MTIKELLSKYRKKELGCQEYIKECLLKINKFEGSKYGINSVITLNDKESLKKADLVDKKIKKGGTLGKLEGVPIAVKDVICTKGIRSTGASKILDNYIPPYDATCVKRLKKEGAIIIAKTNCDEFAHGASGENSAYGPTKNPYDLERVPGGSSSGPAAIVAYGGAVAAIGTDTGGSIRCPASFCGLTGLKPTYGRASRYGLMSMCSSTDTVSPIANSSEDVALILSVICGKDGKDSTVSGFEGKDFTRDFLKRLRGIKVAYVKETMEKGLDPKIKNLFIESLKKLEKAGAKIDEISLPLSTEKAVAVYYIITPSEISSNLAKYDGIKYGMNDNEAQDLDKVYNLSRNKFIGSESKRRIILGTFALSSGYYDEYYNKAQKVRRLMKEEAADAFERFDILATPAMPMKPFKLGEKSDPLSMYLTDVNLSYASLTNICAVSVNCGWIDNDNREAVSIIKNSKNKLPVGIQFMAKWWDEETLLRTSYNFEKIL
ncbi:MAG: Asp-tRNA(Asn)/Glu-tRNA(Gln) amidotransferase subunit GatA [Candidatus Moranbacteria bacterium]|nr:Asp-tRNA(Asn)/Glu-tRNA(Gln) amidotransferase subunit GatA [Candidatus Moranbacteria bacterium]